MVARVSAVLRRFTTAWATQWPPAAILGACAEAGYTAWRDRVLTPGTTVPLFLWQLLQGHTACRHLPPLSGWRCTAAAYGQARARLPVRCFALRFERFGRAVQRSAVDDGRWQGHRPLLGDGSGGAMPAPSALQDAFGQSPAQRPGCGVPVAPLLGLFPAGTGVLLKRVVAPRLTHDRAQVPQVHPLWAPGEVRVADRGRCSDAHLARLVQASVPAGLRVGARQMVEVTPARPLVRPSGRRTSAVQGVPRSRWLTALGLHDHLVAWVQPTTWPAWLTREALAALPETWVRREVRDHIGRPGFRTRQSTLVTTLLDAGIYRVADLAARSRQRWQLETALAHLTTTMRRDGWHGTTVPGVRKELTGLAMVDNVVRRVMGHSAIRQHIAVERISFLDALRWLGTPSTGMPLIALIVNPARPYRVEPRVKKRRPKSFPLMIKPRQELRRQLVQQTLGG